MSEIASKAQLRLSFLRWAIVTVPAILFLGFLFGQMANSGYDNGWFLALKRPDIMPPGWVFGVVWSTLYVLMGLSVAMILYARGAQGRGFALFLFGLQLVFNLAWSPLFFALHHVSMALVLIFVILALTIWTTFAFARIRKAAAWLLVPYMVWLSFAAILNYKIDQLNPDAENLVSGAANTQIQL